MQKQPIVKVRKYRDDINQFNFLFSKEALELINSRSICLFFTTLGILIRLPTIDDKNVKKISPQKTTTIRLHRITEDIIGVYQLYRQDEDHFLLQKIII